MGRGLVLAMAMAALAPTSAALACGGMVSSTGSTELLGYEALLRWPEDGVQRVAYPLLILAIPGTALFLLVRRRRRSV